MELHGGIPVIAVYSLFIAIKVETLINNGNNLNVQSVVRSQEPLVTASTRP